MYLQVDLHVSVCVRVCLPLLSAILLNIYLDIYSKARYTSTSNKRCVVIVIHFPVTRFIHQCYFNYSHNNYFLLAVYSAVLLVSKAKQAVENADLILYKYRNTFSKVARRPSLPLCGMSRSYSGLIMPIRISMLARNNRTFFIVACGGVPGSGYGCLSVRVPF